MSDRAIRMVERTPAYYHYSKIFYSIQKAVADDLDARNTDQEDILPQLFILTATWGLYYWEEILGIPTVEADGYELRRSRVLAAWRGIGNFGVDLIAAIISAYTKEPFRAWLEISTYTVVVDLEGDLSDFNTANSQVQNIIHAHLGLRFRWHVKQSAAPVQDPHLVLTMADKTNFWTRASSTKFVWNGAYTFNGSQNFDGLIDSTDDSRRTTQNHVVTSFYRLLNEKTAFTLDKKFNRRFKFDGGHSFAPITDPVAAVGNTVSFQQVKGGVVISKGVL